MRAMRAEGFSGYKDLKLVDIPKSAVPDGRVLVRITAAGVTPLEHTILSGGYPRAKAPLVLGGEGAGVVEEGGGTAFPAGSRVMFTGPYGVSENGTYSEWIAVRKEKQARSLGFDEVIDLSVEKLSDGVRRITEGYGADIVIDAMGGEILSEALGEPLFDSRQHRGSFGCRCSRCLSDRPNDTELCRICQGQDGAVACHRRFGRKRSHSDSEGAAGRKATIDVTDLIWKRASMKSFSLFSQPAEVWTTAWSVIFPLLQSGAVKPIVAKTFPLAEAADALRYLVESRPFGKVVLTI
jgi:NADPH2:quinone reductase